MDATSHKRSIFNCLELWQAFVMIQIPGCHEVDDIFNAHDMDVSSRASPL